MNFVLVTGHNVSKENIQIGPDILFYGKCYLHEHAAFQSVGRLATALFATKNDIIFSFCQAQPKPQLKLNWG